MRSSASMTSFLILISSLLALCLTSQPVHAASSGNADAYTKDLRQWNPSQGDIAILDGPWQFYWQQFIPPQQFSLENPVEEALTEPVFVPAEWNSYAVIQDGISNDGYATYRMNVMLSDDTASRPLGLYVNNIASAYRIWVNGELLGGNGSIGTSMTAMVPRTYPLTYYFVPQPGMNEIVIHVSNFVQRTGGIWEPIEIGDATTIAALQRDRVSLWMLSAGCLLLMALYSTFLYLFRKKEVAALWFGLICAAICIRSSLLGPSLAYTLFPQLSWEWGVKLEYISEIATIVAIAAFVNRQYPNERVKGVFGLFSCALAAFTVFVGIAPARIYTEWLVPYILCLLLPVFLYVLYVYVLAAIRRRTGSWMNIVGFTAFFATVVHEVLYYTGYVSHGGLVTLGLLLFLLTQLLNLSSLFSRAMTQSERLSQQLNETIAAQEETIRVRTSSLVELNTKLEDGYKELRQIEQTRSTLLADLYHDLSTPLTAIKGISKAMMTGVISEEVPQYARRIYDRSNLLEKMIDNMIELSQLKTRDVQFQYTEVPLIPYFRQLTHRYEHEATTHGIRLTWEEPDIEQSTLQQHLWITIDPFRLERVFANLISNAVKFTPESGTIRIGMEIHRVDHRDQQKSASFTAADFEAIIHITDSGIGIPEGELQNIFQRKYRTPEVRQSYTGSGLGLAICREVMQLHRGSIGVHSNVARGSDFYLVLPATYREVPANRPTDVIDEGDGDDDDDKRAAH